MKLQYLGDAKDCFKWDYHDYLLSELGFTDFTIALMLTPDDESNDGNLHPSLFPARSEIINYCFKLREERSIDYIKKLPKITGKNYGIGFHKKDIFFTNEIREKYFSSFKFKNKQQLYFIDPDNGFEPEKSCSEKHIKYTDIDKIINELSSNSVVSIFQHSRRIKFEDDYKRIKERIISGHSTAIFTNSLMFVLICRSKKVLNEVIAANKKYMKKNPVYIMT